MISNIFIDHILSKVCVDYVGCFPADHIPVRKLLRRKKFCVIVNLSESNLPGTHFICIKKTSHREVAYFDSYAYPPFVSEIVLLLKKLRKKSGCRIWRCKTKIQADNSVYCGFFLYGILPQRKRPSKM